MNEEKQNIFYSADGVHFTIYKTSKSTKSGAIVYWLLENYTTGKRRLLNNLTKKAAQQRADKIRAAMVNGQASRLAMSNGEWPELVAGKPGFALPTPGPEPRFPQTSADADRPSPLGVALPTLGLGGKPGSV